MEPVPPASEVEEGASPIPASSVVGAPPFDVPSASRGPSFWCTAPLSPELRTRTETFVFVGSLSSVPMPSVVSGPDWPDITAAPAPSCPEDVSSPGLSTRTDTSRLPPSDWLIDTVGGGAGAGGGSSGGATVDGRGGGSGTVGSRSGDGAVSTAASTSGGAISKPSEARAGSALTSATAATAAPAHRSRRTHESSRTLEPGYAEGISDGNATHTEKYPTVRGGNRRLAKFRGARRMLAL